MFEKEAEEYVEGKGKEHFRKFYDKQLSMADLLKTCCIEFANEVTKELQAQIEKMKFDAVKEAFRQGEVIQYNLDGEWVDWREPTFDDEPCNYRIKEK